MEEDIRHHDEVGSETFSMPLLQNGGMGIKEDFHIFSKAGKCTGTVKLHTTWEAPTPVKEPIKEAAKEPAKELAKEAPKQPVVGAGKVESVKV